MNKSLLITSLLLSYTPIVAHSSGLQVIDPSLKDGSVQAQILPSAAAPIRISRAFLEETTLNGKITVSLPEAKYSNEDASAAQWSQEPPKGPAPGPKAIADYRDFKGCETFTDLDNPVQLCFNVMPDVSSVGVNQKELQVVGLEQYVASAIQNSGNFGECTYQVTQLQLQKADRSATNASIQYVGEVTPSADCGSNAQPQLLHVQLELSK